MENVLHVEGLKYNPFRLSQMCDQGHTLTCHSQCYEIRKVGIEY